jgi:hypothetical protein
MCNCRSASSGNGTGAAAGKEEEEEAEVGGGARLGVRASVAAEWQDAPVVHLCLLRFYQSQLWQEEVSRKGNCVLRQGQEQAAHRQQRPGCLRGLRVRALGGIQEMMAPRVKVEDGTALQEMETTEYLLTHSLGAGLGACV